MHKKHDLPALLKRYQQGNCTDEERAIVESWLLHELEQTPDLPNEDQLAQADAKMSEALSHHLRSNQSRSIWLRIAAAASILLILSAGAYLVLQRQQPVQIAKNQTHDVTPGHNQATLTLADGRKILLTKGLKGQLATQGMTVIQADTDNISYHAEKPPVQITYNTLTTSRGEKSPYPLVLADGTKVWLNAASSITFPTAFRGKERVVKMTGEAYFEVAHNDQQEFKVISPGQVTEDIGTHFNISAYADDPVAKVTLVEGAVKVNGHLLKPGEQTINTAGIIKIVETNVGFETAWKDGYFRFTDAPIDAVMRELARWYNIEVIYEGKLTNDRFNAKISRYKNISAVLRLLEKTKGVDFKIEGRRVTVLNKA